ncbi:MAG: hypothetical protein JNN20_11985 [Betaproteobacteria bacterium]|nr:hypothetical protein [Betaproteobacteria bacterium]
MKAASKVILFFAFAAGSAVASTQPSAAEKLTRVTSPALCYLEQATTERDAALVRSELSRRNVACSAEQVAIGEAVFQRSQATARMQKAGNDVASTRVARERYDRMMYERNINCSLKRQGYCYQ